MKVTVIYKIVLILFSFVKKGREGRPPEAHLPGYATRVYFSFTPPKKTSNWTKTSMFSKIVYDLSTNDRHALN